MRPKLGKYWESLRSSLWFVPSIIVAIAATAAILLVRLDGILGTATVGQLPLVLGAGPEGARGMLGAIASSVLTLVGVTFSITIVALTLAASTYTPRILRNFTSDRGNQVVLGILTGTYVYSLLVLRTIRTGENSFNEEGFVPELALTGALVLALVSLGAFIYFIHHIAQAIQVSHIASEIEKATAHVMDRLFPNEVGRAAADEEHIDEPRSADTGGVEVPADRSGYIQLVQTEYLLRLITKHDLTLRMERAVGEFAGDGCPLATLFPAERVNEKIVAGAQKQYVLGSQRTLQQDMEFGFRQLVDIALKALSPGINDPTTAVNCIDRLGSLLYRLAGREMPSRYRYDQSGRLRVIARAPSFTYTLDLAFDQIRASGNNYHDVLVRLLGVLTDLARVVDDPHRRQALVEHANRISGAAEQGLAEESGRREVNEHLRRLAEMLSDAGQVRTIPVHPQQTV